MCDCICNRGDSICSREGVAVYVTGKRVCCICKREGGDCIRNREEGR